jgi:hypothetical protein
MRSRWKAEANARVVCGRFISALVAYAFDSTAVMGARSTRQACL